MHGGAGMTTYDRLRALGLSVETCDAWARCLDQWDERDRECILLRAEHFTQPEIAEKMGVRLFVVQKRLKRGGKRLCQFCTYI